MRFISASSSEISFGKEIHFVRLFLLGINIVVQRIGVRMINVRQRRRETKAHRAVYGFENSSNETTFPIMISAMRSSSLPLTYLLRAADYIASLQLLINIILFAYT